MMALCLRAFVPSYTVLSASTVRFTLKEYSSYVAWEIRPCRCPGFKRKSCKMKVSKDIVFDRHLTPEQKALYCIDSMCCVTSCLLVSVHGTDLWSLLKSAIKYCFYCYLQKLSVRVFWEDFILTVWGFDQSWDCYLIFIQLTLFYETNTPYLQGYPISTGLPLISGISFSFIIVLLQWRPEVHIHSSWTLMSISFSHFFELFPFLGRMVVHRICWWRDFFVIWIFPMNFSLNVSLGQFLHSSQFSPPSYDC